MTPLACYNISLFYVLAVTIFSMNIHKVDLNLLVYYDVLLRERSVTRAAAQLGITQPAMSNVLKRLRDLFGDPLLLRTSEGMTPTARALELEPVVHSLVVQIDSVVRPANDFDHAKSKRIFRIMASDYTESTLIPRLLKRLRKQAPGIILDVLTPSDITFLDVEQGRVDMASWRRERALCRRSGRCSPSVAPNSSCP